MEREQIIKALECCADANSCYDGKCPYKHHILTVCTTSLSRDALSLIKELTAKTEAQDITISELRQKLEKAQHDADRYARKIEELTEVNERMMVACRMAQVPLPDGLEIIHNFCQKQAKKAKADTVRKMQDMVAVHFGTYTDKDTVKVLDVFRLLDKIANEMLEGGTDG